jgi:RNA polymerase sigma-70 factor, ECF subfamily
VAVNPLPPAPKTVDLQWAVAGLPCLRSDSVSTLIDVDTPGLAPPTTIDTTPAHPSSDKAERHRQFECAALPLLRTLQCIAWQLTRNVADAEDLLQDTMVRAYTAFPTMQSQAHIKAWFIRIMRNIWIDDYRRSQRRPTERLTGDITEEGQPAHDRRPLQTRDALEILMMEPSLHSEVRIALRSLPEDLRRPLYFAYVEGYPYKDIAQMEAIPVGTVMSRLYRARRRMRELLANRVPRSYVDELAADADVE